MIIELNIKDENANALLSVLLKQGFVEIGEAQEKTVERFIRHYLAQVVTNARREAYMKQHAAIMQVSGDDL